MTFTFSLLYVPSACSAPAPSLGVFSFHSSSPLLQRECLSFQVEPRHGHDQEAIRDSKSSKWVALHMLVIRFWDLTKVCTLSLSLYSSCVGGTNSSFFLAHLSIHPGLFPGANFYAQARLCTGAGRLLVLLFNHPYPQLIVSVVQPLATVFPCNLTQISSHGHLHLSSPPDLYLPCSSRGAYRGTLLPFLC